MTKLQRQIERILLDDLLTTQEQCKKIEEKLSNNITEDEKYAIRILLEYSKPYLETTVEVYANILEGLLKRIK